MGFPQAFKRILMCLALAFTLLAPSIALARGHGGSGGHHSSGSRSSGGYRSHSTSHGSFHSSRSTFHTRMPRAHGHHGGFHALHPHHASSVPHPSHGKHARAEGVTRDSHGRIKRGQPAKNEFKRSHPCPSTGKSGGACPGYVIDHVQALKHGGQDAPANMQWQTKAAAKEKDKWE